MWEKRPERKGGSLNHAEPADYYDEFGFSGGESPKVTHIVKNLM